MLPSETHTINASKCDVLKMGFHAPVSLVVWCTRLFDASEHHALEHECASAHAEPLSVCVMLWRLRVLGFIATVSVVSWGTHPLIASEYDALEKVGLSGHAFLLNVCAAHHFRVRDTSSSNDTLLKHCFASCRACLD